MVKAILEKPVFLKKLKEVFETLEDLDQTEELGKIYRIFRMLGFFFSLIIHHFLYFDLLPSL